jgi:hypothetical protein
VFFCPLSFFDEEAKTFGEAIIYGVGPEKLTVWPPLSRTSAAYVPQIPSSNRISAPGADRILWQAGFLSPALQVPTAFPLRSKAFRFGSKKPEHWTIDLL